MSSQPGVSTNRAMLGLQVHPFGLANGAELALLPHGVALHLVDGRGHARHGEQVRQLLAREVAEAGGARLAGVVQLLHRRPGRRRRRSVKASQ